MIGRAFGYLLLAICLAEAVVEFPFSRIYDEYDFKGQSSVVIDDLCSDSCLIYASISPEAKKLASNILLQLPKGFVSLADVAAGFDAVTKQKTPLTVNATKRLTVVNVNAQMDAGPLVLYVISQVYQEVQNVEVYEAESFVRPVSTLPNIITVMSARPFTLHQDANEDDGEGVMATMTGYDGMYYGYCPDLFHSASQSFPGFTWEVNGPIISVMFDGYDFNKPPGKMTATIGITNTRQLERSGWIGSPGYNGCAGRLPYRSSLYDNTSPFYAELTNKKAAKIILEVSTNSDAAHAVSLTDQTTGESNSVSDTGFNAIAVTFANATNITITWTPEGTGKTGFVAYWHSTVG